jgi:hypothetical protein
MLDSELDEVVLTCCPQCGGFGDTLGGLGCLTWYRCPQCGADYSVEHGEE